MADNIAVTAGSGTTLASNDIGGVQYRRTKLSLGAAGSATDAVGGAGAVSAAVARVTLASDDPVTTLITNLSKAEDAVHVSSDQGIQALTVRKDTAAATAGTDGDYQPLTTDANGRVHAILSSVTFAEDAAHTDGDKGLFVLGKRTDAPASSAGTTGDYATLNTDADGKLWVTRPETVISVTPVVSVSPAYAAGDAVGGKQTLTSAVLVAGATAVLESLTVVDKSNTKPVIDIIFFDADPTVATITDNAAFVFSTDIAKVIGRVRVAAADYATVASNAIATLTSQGTQAGIGAKLKTNGTTSIFAAVVLVSGTPTLLTTGDLVFKYGLRQN